MIWSFGWAPFNFLTVCLLQSRLVDTCTHTHRHTFKHNLILFRVRSVLGGVNYPSGCNLVTAVPKKRNCLAASPLLLLLLLLLGLTEVVSSSVLHKQSTAMQSQKWQQCHCLSAENNPDHYEYEEEGTCDFKTILPSRCRVVSPQAG